MSYSAEQLSCAIANMIVNTDEAAAVDVAADWLISIDVSEADLHVRKVHPGDVGVTDHGALMSLTDDDHTQYPLLLGRAGGQTLIGGTASGNGLTLQSTSHATKGDILLNGKVVVKPTANSTTSAQFQNAAGTSNILNIDTTNERVGIGTASPGSPLEVAGKGQFGTATATTAQLVVQGGQSGKPLITLDRTSGATIAFSWALAGGGLSFKDDTNDQITTNIFGNLSLNQMYLGQKGKIFVDTNNSLLSATTHGSGAGTDVAGTWLKIQGGLGTGAGVPGDIFFDTGNTGTTGTTPHTASTRVTIKADTGYVGIGTTSPSTHLHVAGATTHDDIGTPPTPATNTCIFYGDDVSGTVEGFVADEAANHTQLSSHPPDAPPDMLSGFDYVPLIHKTIRFQLGEIHWVHGEKNDPVVPTDRWVIIESFSNYNSRTGESLEALDVAAENTSRNSAWQTKRQQWLDDLDVWRRQPRSQRGEMPTLEKKPRPIPAA